MKKFLSLIFLPAFIISCQKEVVINSTVESGVTVSSDASAPLKFHALTFSSDYPTVNNILPSSFVKEAYTDTRIKSINMITRSAPNYTGFVQGYYKWEYKISYSLNRASMYGRRTKFENGKPVSVLFRNFAFYFNTSGYCTDVIEFSDARDEGVDLHLTYTSNGKTLIGIKNYQIDEGSGFEIGVDDYDVISDGKGNVLEIKNKLLNYPTIKYTYNLNSVNKNGFYQSTQYAIGQWYAFVEAMQWVPPSKNERASVALKFPNKNNVVVTQSQKYFNHKYDVNGNLLSYTYGDGVLQKITWK